VRAICYVRVSTDKQAKNGLSLEAQDAKLKAMATVRGDEVVDIVVDEESAKTGSLKREGVQRLLKMVKAGEVDAVIVCKLDRLTRSLRDLADILEVFDKHNVALVSVAESLDTKSASGRLVINIMTAVSQWEREAIGERTKAVMDFKKSRGERLGNIPYGWKDDGSGNLVIDPEEWHVREVAKSLYHGKTKGYAKYTVIATVLNNMGYKTRRGGEWRREYVARILKSA
jgi:DNA invertase Pin-like site-specific DNA recombinase